MEEAIAMNGVEKDIEAGVGVDVGQIESAVQAEVDYVERVVDHQDTGIDLQDVKAKRLLVRIYVQILLGVTFLLKLESL